MRRSRAVLLQCIDRPYISATFCRDPELPDAGTIVRPPPTPRIRGHPYHARGGGRVPQAGDALFHRQGFHRHAARGAEGLLPGRAALPPAPRRHDVEVQGDDRLPRRGRAPRRHGADRPHQPGRAAPRHLAGGLGLLGAHAGDEDRGAAPGARPARLRRGLRRRAARRGEEPRQGARLLAPLGGPRLGPAQPAPGALAPLQHAHPPGREHAGVPAVELDRVRRVGLHPGRGHPGRAALLRQGAAGGASATAPSSWWTTSACP